MLPDLASQSPYRFPPPRPVPLGLFLLHAGLALLAVPVLWSQIESARFGYHITVEWWLTFASFCAFFTGLAATRVILCQYRTRVGEPFSNDANLAVAKGRAALTWVGGSAVLFAPGSIAIALVVIGTALRTGASEILGRGDLGRWDLVLISALGCTLAFLAPVLGAWIGLVASWRCSSPREAIEVAAHWLLNVFLITLWTLPLTCARGPFPLPVLAVALALCLGLMLLAPTLPLGGLESPLFIPALGTLALVGQFALLNAMPHLEEVFAVTLLLTALGFWLASMAPLPPWASIRTGDIGWVPLYLLVNAARFLLVPFNLSVLFLATDCPDEGLKPLFECLSVPLPWAGGVIGTALATVRLAECGARPTAVGFLVLIASGSRLAYLLM